MCVLYPFEEAAHGVSAGARSIRESTRGYQRLSGDYARSAYSHNGEARPSGETARSDFYYREKPAFDDREYRDSDVADEYDYDYDSDDARSYSHDYDSDNVSQHYESDYASDRYYSDYADATTGKYSEREMPDYSGRDWTERAFTIGIGGPVGSGKTALLLALCRALRDKHNIAAVTNDIFTREDQEFLIRNEALPKERIRAIETGGCPHAAIREDISANLHALEELQAEFDTELLFVESGGDNLAANYSRELADYIIYVIDVAGGDKVPRKGGPGITQSDLFVINKIDLAPHVGASLEVMRRDSATMRESGSTLFTSVRDGEGVDAVIDAILSAWKASGAFGKGRAQASV